MFFLFLDTFRFTHNTFCSSDACSIENLKTKIFFKCWCSKNITRIKRTRNAFATFVFMLCLNVGTVSQDSSGCKGQKPAWTWLLRTWAPSCSGRVEGAAGTQLGLRESRKQGSEATAFSRHPKFSVNVRCILCLTFRPALAVWLKGMASDSVRVLVSDQFCHQSWNM